MKIFKVKQECKNFLAIFFDKTTIITMQTQLKRSEGV